MDGILISVNPFFLEYVPFERVKRAATISYEVFGSNAIIYQPDFFYEFQEMGLTGTLSFDKYVKYASKSLLSRRVEFFQAGRAPYELEKYDLFPRFPARLLMSVPCKPTFLRSWHNHFDNYGNFLPGFCGGLSLGPWQKLEDLINEGIEVNSKPILHYLIEDKFSELFEYAQNHGYTEQKTGYLSKCHLCTDIRKFLAKTDNYQELQPKAYYAHIEQQKSNKKNLA